MANCPALSTANGSLVLSTTETADGTNVVIGCSGFGRHKTEPVNVLCSNGAWSPAPTTDCKSGFDEKEILILGVSVGCAFLTLVVIILLCCSCFFYRRRRQRHHWWKTHSSGDERFFVNGGTNRYSYYSSPRNTVRSRHETILRDYGDYRPEWSLGRSKGYSHYERWRTDNNLPARTEVYTREAFVPGYDFFGAKQSVSKISRDQVDYTQSRRHSDEFNGGEFEHMRTRRYSAGSRADMMRRSQFSTSRQAEYVKEPPSIIEYHQYSTSQPVEHQVIETFTAPTIEPIYHYTDHTANAEYVEQTIQYVDSTIDYTSPFYNGSQTGPFVLTNEMFRGYTTLGNSVTSLPRARITELGDDSDMKVVPYQTGSRSSNDQSLDPSIYFTGRQDFVPDSPNV